MKKINKEDIRLRDIFHETKNLIRKNRRQIRDEERLDLEAKINFYKLSQANGTSFDEDEQREQRRRLWKLSIIKNKEDDEFLRKLGLVHLSKIEGDFVINNGGRRLNRKNKEKIHKYIVGN